MKYLNRLNILKGRRLFSLRDLPQSANYKTLAAEELYQSENNEIGSLYRVPDADAKILAFDWHLPSNFKQLTATLQEYTWMFRQQTFEVFNCLRALEPGQPATRVLIWGKWGTGKTITLFQLSHLAFAQKCIIVMIKDAMLWARDNYYEVQASTYKSGRLNSPRWSTKILEIFKAQNQPSWETLSKLKTTKRYQWSQIEHTDEGKPITEIVEIGLSAPFLATDCVGALFRELRIHATFGEFKLVVLIDKGNGLYGKSVIRRPDRTVANVEELALIVQVRKFLFPTWSNGLCAIVADQAEVSNSRDTLTIVPIEPEVLFGDEGFEQLKPFVSVKTSLYSEKEVDSMHEYFLDKNWIHQENGPSGEEAKKQMFYLSAFNPALYERICAMSWNLKCVPPPVVKL